MLRQWETYMRQDSRVGLWDSRCSSKAAWAVDWTGQLDVRVYDIAVYKRQWFIEDCEGQVASREYK